MAIYAIGDIQGCFAELQMLLAKLAFSPSRDQLFLVGDLVNRGPQSLAVLQWARQHEGAVRMVLGNHDLHMMAVLAGATALKRKDTFADLLNAGNGEDWLSWLCQQPLAMQAEGHLFIHAGLLPAWSAPQVLALSAEVQNALQDDAAEFLSHLYGNQPRRWDAGLQGWDRLRFIVNACTRMRLLESDSTLDFDFKGELPDAPEHLHAWFDLPRQPVGMPVVCGHWSALGLLMREELCMLDTGCVWGRQLTAISLPDRRVITVDSQQPIARTWD